MQEIFGPVLSVYVYPDQKYKETLELVRKLTVVTFVGISFSKSSLPRTLNEVVPMSFVLFDADIFSTLLLNLVDSNEKRKV